MILLSFTAQNHKSVRDEATLDFVRPSLRTLRPRDGITWEQSVYPVLGIFGGNATGKSTLLDAMAYMFAAIRRSATDWQASDHMQRAPFGLDEHSRMSISRYKIDFIHKDRRYEYGFEVGPEKIEKEWLRDLPSTRWRMLFERETDRKHQRFHSSIPNVSEVTQRELILSRAHLLGHSVLAPIAEDLLDSFDIVAVTDKHRENRLRSIADALAEGALTFSDIVELLRVADIGVESVTVAEDEVPRRVQAAFRAFQQVMETSENEETTVSVTLDEEESDAVVRSLLFTHSGSGEERPAFSIHDESDGTLAWLALAVPAIDALRSGGLYCVDEIDSSLHPHLLELLLGVFADPTVNTKAAQLLFTSHETYILSPMSSIELDPEQIWFTDKAADGATELFSLDDFPRHKDANVAKRYLEGRYGGVPRLMPSVFASLVEAKDD